MDYNFDDRLMWEEITLNKDNFVDGMIRLNGIYYRYQSIDEPLVLGQKYVIVGLNGNILMIQKERKV